MKALALISLILCLIACGPPPSGEVIQKVYTPPISGSGWGTGTCTGVAGNGTIISGSCQGTVYYSEPEKWTLILRGDDGHTRARLVSPDDWSKAEVGGHFE